MLHVCAQTAALYHSEMFRQSTLIALVRACAHIYIINNVLIMVY